VKEFNSTQKREVSRGTNLSPQDDRILISDDLIQQKAYRAGAGRSIRFKARIPSYLNMKAENCR